MLTSLVFVCAVLSALLFMLCALLFRQQNEALRKQTDLISKLTEQQELLLSVGVVVSEIEQRSSQLEESQINMNSRLEHLATDFLQRDIYQTADDRHRLAIQGAKQGIDSIELMQRHGLSSDEAALLLSLHSPERRARSAHKLDELADDKAASGVI